jgi:hypothetical protein
MSKSNVYGPQLNGPSRPAIVIASVAKMTAAGVSASKYEQV